MIVLARDGTQLGTFTPDEVREGLHSGRFQRSDSHFIEGMAEWRPLGEWVPPVAPRHRSFALPALLGCGAVSLLGILLAAGIGLYLLPRTPTRPKDPFPETVALFRMGMLHDWKATVHRYGDEEIQRQFADWSVAMWDPVDPEVAWSWWFGTSMLTAVELEGSKPRTAFYHPWSDTFWLAEWDLRAQPRITKTWFGAGDVLRSRGKPPWDEAPLWLRGHGSRSDALAGALLLSIPAAEDVLTKREWPDAATKDTLAKDVNTSLCRTTLVTLFADLVSLQQATQEEDVGVRRLRDALSALRRLDPAALTRALHGAPDNGDGARSALAGLPAPLAASLQPVCRQGAGNTALVVLMPSQSTDVALATVWDTGGRRARLLRVDVLPFAELLNAARRGKRP